MNIYLIILVEFLFISLLILFLFKLRGKLGLAPLYILLGSVQYLQANIGGTVSFKLFNTYSIYPGSVILFSAVLFATLLVYIKEGVVSTRALIFGIIIGNAALSLLFGITYMQEGIADEIAGVSFNANSMFKINYRIFIIGTIILLLDFFLLAIVYQFLINKLRRLPLFVVIFLSLFLILMFDGIAFTTGVYYNTPGYTDALISHLIGKSISAFLFSLMLYGFMRFIDKRKSPASFIADQHADVFSIIKFRKAYGSATERKLASQLEVTLSNISDAFVSLDKDWNYSYVNNKAAEIFGRKAEDLIGKNIWTEFPEGVGQPFHKAYYKAMATQETQYLLEYYPPYDKWFENKIYPSKEGLTIYFSDITAVKKAEVEKQKLISLIETANDFIGLATLEGKAIFLNENGRKLVGLTADEDISGFNVTQFFPEEYKDIIIKDQLPVVMKDGLWAGEIFMQHFKTGKQIPMLMSGFLIRDGKTNEPIAFGIVATDISLRKKAEEQIVKSEKYLDNIINNIGDPVFVKDEQSRLLLVNDAFCKISNLTRADIIGKTMAEEIPEDQIEEFLRIDREVIATGIENINEELLTVRDGETQIISTKKIRFIDEGGNKFLIGTIRDITERKKAEIALKESEEKYRSLSESSLDYIMRYDKTGRHLYMNKAALEISGLKESDVIGKTHQEAGFDVAQSEFWEEKINYVFETGLSVHEQFEWESIKGLVYLDWRLSPEFDENGNVISALGVSRDITDIKQAEKAIIASHEKVKESEEKYRTLVEQATDAIFITDPAGNFITVNESACRLANCTEAEMMQMRINDFVSLLELEKNPFHFKELSKGEVVTTEREMLVKGDKKITIEITAKQLVNENLLVFVRDITEKKLAQKEIVKTSEELRLLMQHLQNVREEERKRIGRELHDDLGQQLTAIKMFTAWIDKRIPVEQEQIKEKLASIIELLDGSNLAMRKILNELRVGILDNDGLLDGLKWLCQQFEDSTAVDLDFTTELNKLKVNEQTAVCVFRVLQESLNNIAKHAAAKNVKVKVGITSGKIKMSIEDDGKGFKMDKLPAINSFGILGMKERVSAVEGKFSIESTPGSGTKTVITVPCI